MLTITDGDRNVHSFDLNDTDSPNSPNAATNVDYTVASDALEIAANLVTAINGAGRFIRYSETVNTVV